MPDAQLATLVGSQFVGLAVTRYVGRIEPLASASIDELVAAIGPTMQRTSRGTCERRGRVAANRRAPDAGSRLR